jgi:hypothetical protein
VVVAEGIAAAGSAAQNDAEPGGQC